MASKEIIKCRKLMKRQPAHVREYMKREGYTIRWSFSWKRYWLFKNKAASLYGNADEISLFLSMKCQRDHGPYGDIGVLRARNKKYPDDLVTATMMAYNARFQGGTLKNRYGSILSHDDSFEPSLDIVLPVSSKIPDMFIGQAVKQAMEDYRKEKAITSYAIEPTKFSLEDTLKAIGELQKHLEEKDKFYESAKPVLDRIGWTGTKEDFFNLANRNSDGDNTLEAWIKAQRDPEYFYKHFWKVKKVDVPVDWGKYHQAKREEDDKLGMDINKWNEQNRPLRPGIDIVRSEHGLAVYESYVEPINNDEIKRQIDSLIKESGMFAEDGVVIIDNNKIDVEKLDKLLKQFNTKPE